MKFRLPRLRFIRSKPSSENALATAISVMEVLESTAEIIPTIGPLFSTIVSAVLGLAKTLQKVNGCKEQCTQLAQRSTALTQHIKDHLKPDRGRVSDELRQNLEDLSSLITDIRDQIEKLLQRSLFYRFMHQSSMTSTLAKCIQQFEDAWHSFDSACLVKLDRHAEQQKEYITALQKRADREARIDDNLPLRLLHWFDIKNIQSRGMCRILDKYDADEYQAKLDGSAVLVRRFKQRPNPSDFDYRSLLLYNPDAQEPHPNLGQVLGRSHPSVEKPFYVLESGSVSVVKAFHQTSRRDFVQHWLTHLIEYLSAHKFGGDFGLPIFDSVKGRWHNHGHMCLPSASLNDQGKLVIDAADLQHAVLGCFNACLNRLYIQDLGIHTNPTGARMAEIPSTMTPATNMLSVLDSGAQLTRAHIQSFIDSELGHMWPYACFADDDINAKLGEYGYVDRSAQQEQFVRLGHIDDLNMEAQKIAPDVRFRHRTQSEGVTPWTELSQWPDHTISREFQLSKPLAPGANEEPEINMRVPRRCLRAFFWDHADIIARAHGIPLHDLVLVDSLYYRALARMAGPSSGQPSRAYFHLLPLTKTKDVPEPWGYWSLDPSANLGTPPPALPGIPGVTLHRWKKVYYSYLNPLEAVIISTLDRMRRSLQDETDSQDRIQEISQEIAGV